MLTRSLLRLAPLVFAGLLSGQATVFRGPTGGPGDVVVHPAPGAPGQRPAELQGITLLPIAVVGDDRYTMFEAERARRVADVPLAGRLMLPHASGSLYRYRRDAAGGAEFGYFVVGANGMARPLAAFPGAGPGGDLDPLASPVAIAAAGDAMLVATSVVAGGDVYEVDLVQGGARLLTGGLPPLEVLSQGLILLPDWGVALTTRGPLRFFRTDGRPLLVPLRPRVAPGALGGNRAGPAQPLAHFGNGIVASADTRTVAVVGGYSPTQAFVFTFGPGGPAVCVNDVAAAVVDPGIGGGAGPTLAVAPDGSRVAWKAMTGATAECFTRRVPTQPTPPEIQVTADANFTDTLDDTGVISFFGRDKLAMLVGEPDGAGGLENADLYLVDLSAGAPAMTNLTQTSGDLAAPFLSKGELGTADGVYKLPGRNGAVYFVDRSSNQGSVYRLDGDSGAIAVVRNDVGNLDFVQRAGDRFVLGVMLDMPARELLSVPFDSAVPPVVLATLPLSGTLLSQAGSPAGIFAGAMNTAGGQRMFVIHVPSGTGAVWPDVLQATPVMGFDGGGAALSAQRVGTQALFVSWDGVGSGALYGQGPLGSIVLPGN